MSFEVYCIKENKCTCGNCIISEFVKDLKVGDIYTVIGTSTVYGCNDSEIPAYDLDGMNSFIVGYDQKLFILLDSIDISEAIKFPEKKTYVRELEFISNED